MNDSSMNYDMLRAIAVQVSQELYRQAEADAERAPSGTSYRDAIAWVRARLAIGKQRLQPDCASLSHADSRV